MVEPGGARIDFTGRSLNLMQQPVLTACYAPLAKVIGAFGNPESAVFNSDASQIAELIFRLSLMAARRATLSDEDDRAMIMKDFNL